MSVAPQLVPTSFTDDEIFSLALRPSEEIGAWTLSTARELGITQTNGPHKDFVRAVSRLSDGAVDLDTVEELLIELGKAEVLTAFQQSLLQLHYLLNSKIAS